MKQLTDRGLAAALLALTRDDAEALARADSDGLQREVSPHRHAKLTAYGLVQKSWSVVDGRRRATWHVTDRGEAFLEDLRGRGWLSKSHAVTRTQEG